MPLSTAARASINARNTGEEWCYLLELSHPDLATPFRFVDLPQGAAAVVHGGESFVPRMFEAELPSEGPDSGREVPLRLEDVDRVVRAELRELEGPATVVLKVVLRASPDTVERGPFTFELIPYDLDPEVLDLRLLYDRWLDDQCPKDRFTPENFPALFSASEEG